jgi:hypothetical protein
MTVNNTSATKLLDEVPTPTVSSGPLNRLLASHDLAPLSVYLLASVLCLAIAVIHVQDQGGFLGNVTPAWIAVGYYVVEAMAAITALLFARQQTIAWILGLAVSAGPGIAYILSRTVGLPGDSADIGNWGYLLGTVSLIVEGTLFALCSMILLRALTSQRAGAEYRPSPLGDQLLIDAELDGGRPARHTLRRADDDSCFAR